ncbi:hypothetical protein AB0E27_00435 [Streptomyces sparsogenes]|uniref:DUF6907 domain-containing protein n=1 Tax=Streptomyces sparsogenes TaxID=67365 RepID=UPI0033CAFD92
MTGPRTVTVHTRDHGPITLTCPAWCTAAHEDGGYRVDIFHAGPDTNLYVPTGRGSVLLLQLVLEQRPFTELPPGPVVFTNVGIGDDFYPSSPAALDRIAEALVDHAATVRAAARQLAALLREGSGQ